MIGLASKAQLSPKPKGSGPLCILEDWLRNQISMPVLIFNNNSVRKSQYFESLSVAVGLEVDDL